MKKELYSLSLDNMVPNAFIELNKDSADMIREIPISMIEKYGDEVAKMLVKEGNKVVFGLSRAATIRFSEVYSDFFTMKYDDHSCVEAVILNEGIDIDCLIEKFRTYENLDVLLAFMDEDVVKNSLIQNAILKEKLSSKEIENLIKIGLQDNSVDYEKIDPMVINEICLDYFGLCKEFEKKVIGKMDTFKRAACLLVAINRGNLSTDSRVNSSVAIDVAYKLCEKPYSYVGKKFDIPNKLEEVSFKENFQDDMYMYNTSKSILIDALAYEGNNYIGYSATLELFYIAALEKKHSKTCDVKEKVKDRK